MAKHLRLLARRINEKRERLASIEAMMKDEIKQLEKRKREEERRELVRKKVILGTLIEAAGLFHESPELVLGILIQGVEAAKDSHTRNNMKKLGDRLIQEKRQEKQR